MLSAAVRGVGAWDRPEHASCAAVERDFTLAVAMRQARKVFGRGEDQFSRPTFWRMSKGRSTAAANGAG